MEYNPKVHGIECPKCGHGMDEISYGGGLLIDRCTNCQGLWFDQGETDRLKSKWMTEALEIGRSGKGKRWDAVDDISCPRCEQDMEKATDPDQPHIWYEVCKDHGMFMDAAEFTDVKHQTLSDWFRSLIRVAR
jgi:uncharacterized protein